MRIVSVNVGQPREVISRGRTVLTSIFKSPVQGPVELRGVNLEGDNQADRRVHGGPHKAVYLYAGEHYPYWTNELSIALPWGVFGENLTSEGVLEEEVCIGDQFRFGSTILQVTQPRMPCFKLALRLDRSDMVKRFWKSGRSGIYFSILNEGTVEAGDVIEKVFNHPERITVADVLRIYKGEDWSSELLTRTLRTPLRGSWKSEIQSRLTEAY